jgi:hypothetical protein
VPACGREDDAVREWKLEIDAQVRGLDRQVGIEIDRLASLHERNRCQRRVGIPLSADPLNTSKRLMVGTISESASSIAAANSPAFGPSAKNSSHADESTAFIPGRPNAERSSQAGG